MCTYENILRLQDSMWATALEELEAGKGGGEKDPEANHSSIDRRQPYTSTQDPYNPTEDPWESTKQLCNPTTDCDGEQNGEKGNGGKLETTQHVDVGGGVEGNVGERGTGVMKSGTREQATHGEATHGLVRVPVLLLPEIQARSGGGREVGGSCVSDGGVGAGEGRGGRGRRGGCGEGGEGSYGDGGVLQISTLSDISDQGSALESPSWYYSSSSQRTMTPFGFHSPTQHNTPPALPGSHSQKSARCKIEYKNRINKINTQLTWEIFFSWAFPRLLQQHPILYPLCTPHTKPSLHDTPSQMSRSLRVETEK